MFDYFDHHSKRALAMAQAAAVELHHPAIGQEHLLLGIMNTESPARDALRSFGIGIEQAHDAVEAIVPRGTGDSTGKGGLLLTAEASTAIERADALRRQNDSSDLTPSLLLLSLICDDGGVVNRVLAKLGATRDAVREAVATAG